MKIMQMTRVGLEFVYIICSPLLSFNADTARSCEGQKAAGCVAATTAIVKSMQLEHHRVVLRHTRMLHVSV